jgi:hypothetical protein
MVVMLGLGTVMYFAMGTHNRATEPAVNVRRPGWIARRRAKRGIQHPRGRVGVGYTSALGRVDLTLAEVAGHGLTVGGPKSGKTTFLQLLIDAAAERLPIIVIDPKGSSALADTVREHTGVVWTLDGTLPADLLDPRPHQVPDMLLEAEDYAPDARAYRDAAQQRALWAAWSLSLNKQPQDLAQLRRLLDRETLMAALEPHRGRDPHIADWLTRLEHQHGGIEDSGARGLDRALGTLLDGPAIRGSLRACKEALRLEDVIDTRGLVLFSLDELTYPQATRKIAAWVLLAMGRLAQQLPAGDDPHAPRALLLLDEVGALGTSARHVRALVGRAREAGLSVVMATQGLSDLESVDRALVHQVLQDTAWQLAFRQGSPRDAEHLEKLFGRAWVTVNSSWRSDGLRTKQLVERARVPIDEWMNTLHPGDAWLRVAPIDRGWQQVRVRVALPQHRSTASVNSSVTTSVSMPNEAERALFDKKMQALLEAARETANKPPPWEETGEQRALPSTPPDCPPELVSKMGADISERCERRWPRRHHELGPCLVWTGPRGPNAEVGPYGRCYDSVLGRTDYTHLIVWRRVYGIIPTGPDGNFLEVDHHCDVGLCQRPDHLRLLTKGDNLKRRAAPRQASASARFSVALFEGINRPTLVARTLSLDELTALLGEFRVLEDKHLGACWSPTRYIDGVSMRANSGVQSISCLVFDLDRVPPDEARLTDICWIAHTTWSHTPEAPRWRLILPLVKAVPVRQWTDVWQRAHAALSPEADPACKDPSRAYWLPSHPAQQTPLVKVHQGPLLVTRELPTLPKPKMARRRLSRARSEGTESQRSRAYLAKVIATLQVAAPGNRNAALNRAAWTLGRWIAGGLLQQAEIEELLYEAAEINGLLREDGERQVWATIRSGLAAGQREGWSG